MKNLLISGLILLLFSCSNPVDYSSVEWLRWKKDSISNFPKEHWMKYKTPEEAGWSIELLNKAKGQWEESQSSAFLVIYDGAVLVSWGEIDRRFLTHSARKSLNNAMYGVAVDQGLIDLKTTLAELNITEITPLTPQEKEATVKDLIRSRSGVYLPTAYSLNPKRPPRGSAKPGEKWYYNNWDFNVLQTILERETSTEYEQFFMENIAVPLQMQDFRLMDVYDHKEVRSQHPTHPFRMSARDLARFGLFYLNKGKWKNKQVISSGWIEESTKAHSILSEDDVGNGDYGYEWWVSHDRFKDLGMYYASGLNGQRVRIIPAANLVVVNLVNTYKRHNVFEEEQLKLLDKVLAARVSRSKDNPELEEVILIGKTKNISDSISSEFLGKYQAPWDFDPDVDSISINVEYRNEDLIADIQYGGTFKMIKKSDKKYILEDMDLLEESAFPLEFFMDEFGKPAFRLKLAFVLDKVVFQKR